MGPGTAERTACVCLPLALCSLMSAGQEADFPSDEAFTNLFPVHRACRDGDVGALVSLSQSPAHLTAEDSCYGWTPLHWAAHYGQLECVVRLVQMGCGVNTPTSRFNQTPTHTAAFGGHPHCVVWLTQAGADVNRQDFVGEAPIHKAARSGSLECVQVLLIAGAKPHLRNASGQTAADLAHAHGFLDCFRFVSDPQEHPPQLAGLRAGGAQNGGPWGQASLSRKRLPAGTDSGHTKKARRAEDVSVQVDGGGAEEAESMSVEESAQELGAADDTTGVTNGHHQTRREEPAPPATPAPPANRPAVATAAARRSSPDMCGSLHLTGSPSSCVSQRPAWWGLMGGADCRDFQHYGHYHGFGDTAEELGDVQFAGVQADHRYKQAVAGAVNLYHGS